MKGLNPVREPVKRELCPFQLLRPAPQQRDRFIWGEQVTAHQEVEPHVPGPRLTTLLRTEHQHSQQRFRRYEILASTGSGQNVFQPPARLKELAAGPITHYRYPRRFRMGVIRQ